MSSLTSQSFKTVEVFFLLVNNHHENILIRTMYELVQLIVQLQCHCYILDFGTHSLQSHHLWGRIQSIFCSWGQSLQLDIFHPMWFLLLLGGQRQRGMRSLNHICPHNQRWELNPKPCDLVSNVLSTQPHAPIV